MTRRERASTPLPPDAVVPREGGQSGWVSWVIFAGVMMILLGAFNVIDGLVALFNHGVYVIAENHLLVFDYTTWGWFWLIFGFAAVVAGLGVLAGQTWARVVGVIMAALNAIAHMTFIAAHPAWSILVIALDVIVIYALTAHGAELGQGPTRR